MMNRLVIRLLGMLVALSLSMLVGCSGGHRQPSSAGNRDVKVGWASKVSTLDPILAYTDPDFQTVHLLGAGLYEFTGDGDVHPSVAQSGTESPDRMSWTFNLRPGLSFSDGSRLDADDVVATLERVRTDPTNAFPGLVASWKQVVKVSEQTVRIDLHQPYTDLPAILAEAFTVILPSERLSEGKKFFENPVMAGPYKLVSWGGTDTVVMARNPAYWGPAPAVDGPIFTTVPDATTGMAQVQTGQLDIFPQLPFALRSQLSGAAQAEIVNLYGTISISPNNRSAPFNDQRVRRAISLAVDRDQINRVAFGGVAQPLAGFWPSGIAGWTAQPAPPPDIAAARAALAGTACANGCSVVLMHNSYYPYLREIASVVQQNLKAIGIDMSITSMDTATFYNKVGAGEHQIAISGQYDFLPIPTGFQSYELQFDSGASNYSFYDSPAVRQLIAKVFEHGGSDRRTAMDQIEKLFDTDTPFINVANYPVLVARQSDVDSVRYARTGTIDVKRNMPFPDS